MGDDMTRFGAPDRLGPGSECANVARIPHSSLAAKFRSLMVRKTHNKRIVAIEHKMIPLIYLMLTRRKS